MSAGKDEVRCLASGRTAECSQGHATASSVHPRLRRRDTPEDEEGVQRSHYNLRADKRHGILPGR